MSYSTSKVTVEQIESMPIGTMLGWDDAYYFGLARKNSLEDWDFSDYEIGNKSVAQRINEATSWEESKGWTVLVPLTDEPGA